jgi:hypothetical protein
MTSTREKWAGRTDLASMTTKPADWGKDAELAQWIEMVYPLCKFSSKSGMLTIFLKHGAPLNSQLFQQALFPTLAPSIRPPMLICYPPWGMVAGIFGVVDRTVAMHQAHASAGILPLNLAAYHFAILQQRK